MPSLWLVDGSHAIFRAYHALPHLSTRQGVPTNAVYGFTTMLLKAIREDIDLTRHMDDAVKSLAVCLAADESVHSGNAVKL